MFSWTTIGLLILVRLSAWSGSLFLLARARVGAQSGLGPCPGWGPVRVGAHMGPHGPLWALMGPMGPYGPLWALMGPYGPLWAHKGPISVKKLIILMKNHKIINKYIKVVNLEISKVKTWFGDKDLFS